MMTRRISFFMFLVSSWLVISACESGRIILDPPTDQPDQMPIITLVNGQENFFILSANCAYSVELADPDTTWLSLNSETLEGPQADHFSVGLAAKLEGLVAGAYSTSVRINFHRSSDPQQNDYILLPVLLLVGEDPQVLAQLENKVRHSAISQTLGRTPSNNVFQVGLTTSLAGHSIIDILDRTQLQASRNSSRQLASNTVHLDTDQSYELVFPFMALEFLSADLEDDIADVEPNLDSINMVSYERYRINSGGQLRIIQVNGQELSDPKDWIAEKNLQAWPMIIGYSNDYAVTQMYVNRAEFAEAAVAEAQAMGYSGYVLDVEGSTDSLRRGYYLDFVEHLAEALHQNGFKLMVCQARWSTIAPVADLANTSVDYVGSMDVMHPGWEWRWEQKIPPTYSEIEPERLVWIFSWDYFRGSDGRAEQEAQWAWMQENGYNHNVAGASVFRTPASLPNRYHQIDYYQGFRDYYPVESGVSPDGGQPDADDEPDSGTDQADGSVSDGGNPSDGSTPDGGLDEDPDEDPPSQEGCYSNTLKQDVEHGDCVQVNYSACGQSRCGWYTCRNGGWYCAEEGACEKTAYENSSCNPKNCYSTTWGRWLEHGGCVQVVYAACGQLSCGWLKCNDGFWNCCQTDDCSETSLAQDTCQDD
jgi:hypothetical protein